MALVEFTMVLPLLMFVALLCIFFGKTMLTKQDVLLADRQLAWRQAKQLGNLDSANVRDTYFPNRPIAFLPGQPGSGWDASRQAELLLEGAPQSNEARGFAADTVGQHFGLADTQNVHQEVGVSFPRDSAPLMRFANSVGTRYYRQGIPWQHGSVSVGGPAYQENVVIWGPMRDHFITEFDTTLVTQGTGGDTSLVGMVRQLYLQNW